MSIIKPSDEPSYGVQAVVDGHQGGVHHKTLMMDHHMSYKLLLAGSKGCPS